MSLGFCIVPSLLLRAQPRLGLTAMQLAVLMHLADWWWTKDRKPFPSKKTIGDRLGIGARQVQRHMAALEKMKYVTRIARTAPGKGKTSNEYDLSGLVARLSEIAPEFKAVEEEVKSTRRAITRPGMKYRRKSSGPA